MNCKGADHQDVQEVLQELLETQLSTNEKTSVRIYYILRKAYELDVIDDIVTGETFERTVALLKRTQKRWDDVSIYKTTIHSHWGTYDICNNQQHYSDNVLKALCALSKTGITSTDAKEALQNAIKIRRQLDKAPGVPRDPELQPMDVRAVLEERKTVGKPKKSGKKRRNDDDGFVHFRPTKLRKTRDAELDVEIGRGASADLSDKSLLSMLSATPSIPNDVLSSRTEPNSPGSNGNLVSSLEDNPGFEDSWNERFAC